MNVRKSQPLPKKHVPQRTCIACRRVQGKRSLIRLVRTAEVVKARDEAGNHADDSVDVPAEGAAASRPGERSTQIVIDTTGKLGGRGCYLHPNQQCWHSALKSGKIEQALKVKLSAEDRATLTAYAATLPVSEELPELAK